MSYATMIDRERARWRSYGDEHQRRLAEKERAGAVCAECGHRMCGRCRQRIGGNR